MHFAILTPIRSGKYVVPVDTRAAAHAHLPTADRGRFECMPSPMLTTQLPQTLLPKMNICDDE